MDRDFLYSSAEVRHVKKVQFGVMSPDEIRRMSVAEVKHEVAWERGVPRHEGIMDRRLGASGRDFPCMTCHCDEKNCSGHFGFIELAKPMFHAGFMGMTLKLLRCVCYFCSRLLITKVDDPGVQKILRAVSKMESRAARLRIMSGLCTARKCLITESPDGGPSTGCGHEQPKYKREGLKIRADFPDDGADVDGAPTNERKQNVSAEKVLSVFKRISDSDAELMGLSARWARPEWLILTLLPVPPPHVRPSIMMDATQRGEDDLTHNLAVIVKNNTALRNLEGTGAPAHRLAEQIFLLQFHVATYMNNDLPGMPRAAQKSGRPLKSISQRLKGKEGRLRGNLMGKRVDFSARTVITPDPNLMLDEVGVPYSIAKNLTFPETVTAYNIEEMQKLVENGPDEYPGAKYIQRDDGYQVNLAYVRNRADLQLEIGYKVVRHITDGDFIVFNRQPSLHKMSIMGHRIRVMPYSTFRLNLSVTSPYNADFDGDEMNLHVPQTHATRAEVMELMMVPRCIVSPQGNKPVMGIVQDTLLGCMLFTYRDTFLRRDVTMSLLLHVVDWDGVIPPPAIIKPEPLWTGKQLFSLLLPDVNLVRYCNTHPDDESTDISPGDTRVLIVGGELITGIVDKRTVGSAANGLIHVTWKEKGHRRTCVLISAIQVLVNHYVIMRGQSIGIGDTIADAHTDANVRATITGAQAEVTQLERRAQEGELTLLPGKSMMESFEVEVNKVLNGARDTSGSSAQLSLLKSNNIKRMVSAGSKGSFINISQICACVGQQNVEGKRISYGFRRRTLPHFRMDDLGPESRGFVENSYLIGLRPSEFFFHAMGGREGLIDTAVKTAETGYIQRRLVKAMEDVMVKYDGTVRNSRSSVIQFLYGEDGLDGALVEDQKLDTLRSTNDSFTKRYHLTEPDLHLQESSNSPYLSQAVLNDIHSGGDVTELLAKEWAQLKKDRDFLRHEVFKTGEAKLPLAVNIERLIWNAKRIFDVRQNDRSDLSPSKIVRGVELLLRRTRVLTSDEDAEADAIARDMLPPDGSVSGLQDEALKELSETAQLNATLLFQIHVRASLASKVVLSEHRLTRKAFTWLLIEIENRFQQALAPAGEMVGATAAQSIGEPATQMTLNTFHYAGVSAKNVTLGVPRLQEIINVSKRTKTPSLVVYLRGDAVHDAERAKQVQAELQHTTLRHVTHMTEVYYDPDLENTIVPADEELVSAYYELPDDVVHASPWLLRIVLAKDMVVDRKLAMNTIKNRIHAHFGGDLHVMASEDNAAELVIRVRVAMENEDKAGVSDSTKPRFEGEQDADRVAAEMEDEEDAEDLFLRKVESQLLSNLTLSGIPGIDKVFMRQDNKITIDPVTGSFSKENEWLLETDGVNFIAVMGHEDVDFTRTVSNDIVETFEVLGIEAVRATLLNEIRTVISFDGAYVNYRHLSVLVDVMTFRGHLMAISRHGINRVSSSALMKCSFEETSDILLDAAMHGETDMLTGVSESIMLGQLAPLGTGSFGLFLNDAALTDALEPETDAAASARIARSPAMPESERGYTPGREGQRTPGRAFDAAMTPTYAYSPARARTPGGTAFSPAYTGPGGFSPISATATFSPIMSAADAAGRATPGRMTPGRSPAGRFTPRMSPASPGYAAMSPRFGGGLGGGPAGGAGAYAPASPAYMATSPGMGYSPSTPALAVSSPGYSPGYSPTSPSVGVRGGTAPGYASPQSPGYVPTSPAYARPGTVVASANVYSPSSPAYSPSSPNYAAASSPAYQPPPRR